MFLIEEEENESNAAALQEKRIARELKLLATKLRSYKEKQASALRERHSLREQLRKQQKTLKDEKKKYKALQKEVDKMAKLMKDDEEAEEEEEEEKPEEDVEDEEEEVRIKIWVCFYLLINCFKASRVSNYGGSIYYKVLMSLAENILFCCIRHGKIIFEILKFLNFFSA